MVQGFDGNFYGAASGGTAGFGSLFRLTPAGVLTTLYTFTGGSDGAYPDGGLVQGGDGNFYGVATGGGVNGDGTIFKLAPGGTFTLLHTFSGAADGSEPMSALVEGTDGNFYGVAQYGGSGNSGTVFKISSTGSFSLLYSFTGGDDGAQPLASLLQGDDGNFYGSTPHGGDFTDCPSVGCGTLFEITSSGAFTLLWTFTGGTGGSSTETSLVEASDGYLYGTTAVSNSSASALLFKITASTSLTPVYGFANSSDAGIPNNLLLGSDDNFYATSETGGSTFTGSLFAYYRSVAYFENLYSFVPTNSNGTLPLGGLVQGSDGSLYGLTARGGDGHGTIFKLAVTPALAAPVQLSLSSTSVVVGTPVTLSYQVTNAFSDSMEQCYAFVTNNGVTTALGKQSGALNTTIPAYTGSITFTPTAPGTYNYALTCGGVESGFATLTVTGKASSTALQASPDPASVGQSVTLKATVTGSGTTPTGSVTFASGSTLIGTAKLSAGTASYTASTAALPPGTYPVSASYSGDATYSASVSTASSVTLNAAPTATTLTANPTTVAPPATVTLTATVKRSASGATGTPTGSVTFSSGSVTLGTASLNGSGVATYAASSSGIAAGRYPVTAKYNGDSEDAASTSASATVTVE
jgi:uncharacterized repeat protein (TIGR03803 family)